MSSETFSNFVLVFFGFGRFICITTLLWFAKCQRLGEEMEFLKIIYEERKDHDEILLHPLCSRNTI